MNTVLRKLILGKKVTREDIYEGLFYICQDVHSSCDSSCPVYDIKSNLPGFNEEEFDCEYFKNGKLMYDFIKEHGIKE